MTANAQIHVRSAVSDGTRQLLAANVPSAPLAVELLLMHVLQCDRAWLYTHPEEILSTEQAAEFASLLKQRAAGVPTQYLTGRQEFWGMEMEVTPAVLIPRPETEHVVEVSIDRLAATRDDELKIADVGTGTGCIAIALAKEFSKAEIFATDISVKALEVARRNAARHGFADRIHFQYGNLLEPFFLDMTTGAQPQFDLIASNPPYVARRDAETLQREVREHEPPSALYGGELGLDIYPRLFRQAASLLKRDGLIAVEIGAGLFEEVQGLLRSSGGWREIAVKNDLAGIPRVISARRF